MEHLYSKWENPRRLWDLRPSSLCRAHAHTVVCSTQIGKSVSTYQYKHKACLQATPANTVLSPEISKECSLPSTCLVVDLWLLLAFHHNHFYHPFPQIILPSPNFPAYFFPRSKVFVPSVSLAQFCIAICGLCRSPNLFSSFPPPTRMDGIKSRNQFPDHKSTKSLSYIFK